MHRSLIIFIVCWLSAVAAGSVASAQDSLPIIEVKADRTKKKAIMIDEIWQLIGASSNRMAAEFCLNIFKTIRGFGGAAVSATQDLSDFFGLMKQGVPVIFHP